MNYEKPNLALFGGNPVVKNCFKPFNHIGIEEKNAVLEVMESGVLSKFLGVWHDDFFGGPKLRQFEKLFAEKFKVKHAIAVNSSTSALISAIGAIDIQPGDEVIVSPWTMCASATAILHWNAIPVFADIEPHTFNIDPESIRKNITKKTKAIMAVDIFGHSANINSLKEIAIEHDLKIISDTSQSPGALYEGNFAGTITEIGCFSLNYHKHIHTGEGGVLVTNDDELCERLQLIRNHAEAVVEAKGYKNLSNMIGYNFRLGEIESAIGLEQIKKLSRIVKRRQEIANILSRGLKDLEGLNVPLVRENCTHAYYVYPLTIDSDKLEIKSKLISKALAAEGIEGFSSKYVNLHLLPIFQEKIAYGKGGFPWNSELCDRNINYDYGICPVAEGMQDNKYLGFSMCLNDLSNQDAENIVNAFHKIWSNLDLLRNI